ncbi:MAG: DUF2336 domain-containing protein [Alphaproteobacteria bacterium]
MLTISDIEQVRNGGMGAAIVASAVNVAGAYRDSAEASRQREIAEDVLTAWLQGAAQEVRTALSRQLCTCPFLPRGLALKMAADVRTVAIPMLRHSPVFTSEDLCAIAGASDTANRIAIARRREVPWALAETLIATGEESVVATLVRNRGAKLSESLLHRIVDDFEGSQPVHEGLVANPALPISIGERLITLVADHLRQHMIDRFDLPEALAGDISRLSREAAMSSAIPEGDEDGFAETLVAHLEKVNRLTQTFLLRALCDRRLAVFEAGLARRAGLSREETARALRGGDSLVRSNLFLRAGISRLLVRAFDAAVQGFINGAAANSAESNPDRQIRWVINKMVQQYEDIDPSELEAVMTRLYLKLRKEEGKAPADESRRVN